MRAWREWPELAVDSAGGCNRLMKIVRPVLNKLLSLTRGIAGGIHGAQQAQHHFEFTGV